MDQNDQTLAYKYTFTFDDKREKEFTFNLHRSNLQLLSPERSHFPDWTKLDFHKCPNCPLETNKYCPAAVGTIELIEFFDDVSSIEEIDVRIETDSRTYSKHTSMQHGVSSMLGICMATSGCPIIAKLKPMARFHLPFASAEETTFRAMSMYLLGQYFLQLRNMKPDWKFKKLEKIYKDIQIVNRSFARRLKAVAKDDASLNALVILDTFAHFVLFEIDDNILNELENLYSVYFEEE